MPLPKRGIPDAFLTYMNHAFPRIVKNTAGALSTNTIHNVTTVEGVSADALAVAFYNSLTLLSAELVGRSYGGGILKLEPTEAERLLIPAFDEAISEHFEEIDRELRAGNIDRVLETVDALVLSPMGVTKSQISGLRAARRKLMRRRHSRSKKSNEPETNANGGPPKA